MRLGEEHRIYKTYSLVRDKQFEKKFKKLAEKRQLLTTRKRNKK